jgi:TPP-dependent pyruvate/acetoin dehydrogenase alpha subunit
MTGESVAADRRMQSAPSLARTVRRALYDQMVLTLVFETEAERQYKAARIGGYCHLSSGQEATTIGVVHALRHDDLRVTGYRCHGFALARDLSTQSVIAELFGRSDGCAHGRGGSMRLLDVSPASTAAGASSPDNCRRRPASRSRSCVRDDGTPCSTS